MDSEVQTSHYKNITAKPQFENANFSVIIDQYMRF